MLGRATEVRRFYARAAAAARRTGATGARSARRTHRRTDFAIVNVLCRVCGSPRDENDVAVGAGLVATETVALAVCVRETGVATRAAAAHDT
jgi:hypothetical protein